MQLALDGGVRAVTTTSRGDMRGVAFPPWWEEVADADGRGHSLGADAANDLANRAIRHVPVSRVHRLNDIGTIDYPVWAAVTPLAKDLTLHLGKGVCDQLARMSAIFEAVERISAERPSDLSLADSPTSDHIIHTLQIGSVAEELKNDLNLCGWDIMNGAAVVIPSKAVLTPVQLRDRYVADTTGLAAGGHLVEATLHAVYELVERDAVSTFECAQQYGNTRTHRCTVKFPEGLTANLDALKDAIDAAACTATIFEIDSLGDIPTFAVYLHDYGLPGIFGQRATFMGAGSARSSTLALERALTEAVQAHTGYLLGARDSFEGWDQDNMEYDNNEPMPTSHLLNLLHLAFDSEPQIFRTRERSYKNLVDELQSVIGLLRADGVQHIFAVELTDNLVQIPVVRVIIPGLARPLGSSIYPPALRLISRIVLDHG